MYNHSEKGEQSLIKLSIHPPYDPTIPLLGLRSTEMKTYAHKKDFYKNVAFIAINIQNLEIAQLSIKRKRD